MAPKKVATFAVDDVEKTQTSTLEVARPPTPTFTDPRIAPSLSEVPTKETAGADSEFGLTGRDVQKAERNLVRKVGLRYKHLAVLTPNNIRKVGHAHYAFNDADVSCGLPRSRQYWKRKSSGSCAGYHRRRHVTQRKALLFRC